MTRRVLLAEALLIVIGLLINKSALAVECGGSYDSNNTSQVTEVISKCQDKVNSLSDQSKTLQSAISLLNSKISLTQAQIRSTNLQIEQLDKEIAVLSTVVDDLNGELNSLSAVYVSRVREAYKRRQTNPLMLFFTSGSFTTFENRLKYLQAAERRDQVVLKELETSRLDFDQQKTLKEQKQAEVRVLKSQLVQQTAILSQQQKGKQQLLAETKNSEVVYQSLLQKARAELLAIESIIAGKGSESDSGPTNAGQTIAHIIPGASACSTGTHLHFEVVKDQGHQNPANFLRQISVNWNMCGWWGCDSPFSFSGNWDWPLSEPITVTQGYGMTGYAKSGAYGGSPHTGVDMVNEDLNVKAIKNGELYRGSIACGGGTLKYVHVRHADDGYDTYFLHVNYF